MLFDIDRLNGAMPQVRWADPVVTLTTRLMDACISHLGNHLANVVSTEKFLSLGKVCAFQFEELLLELLNPFFNALFFLSVLLGKRLQIQK